MRFFSDPLYRNSFFLILTAGLMAVTGFVFWVLAARLYPAEDVGLAAAAISLSYLIGTFSYLGFDIGSIKFVYEFDAKKVLRNTLTVVFLVSFVLASVTVFEIKLISKKTASILVFPVNLYFILLVVAICVAGVMRQGAFVALRDTKNSFIQSSSSVVRVLVLPLLTFMGPIGILLSFSFMPILSASIGMFLLRNSGYSFKPELDFGLLRSMFYYSFANYLSVLFDKLPGFVLPILVINILGAKENAYFYIAWAIANLIIMIPRSTSMSLFAECSYSWGDIKIRVVRAMKFVAIFIFPGVLFIYYMGDYLLRFFGSNYSKNSFELLKILVLSVFPYSINVIYAAICRARKKIGEVVAIFFTIASVSLVGGYFLLKTMGLIGVGYAWLAGNVISTILVVFLVLKNVGSCIAFEGVV